LRSGCSLLYIATMSSLQSEIESKQNLINLIKQICDTYALDPSISRNITNIKAFLAPLSVSKIIENVKTLTEANAYLTKLYGETSSANHVDIVKDINTTKKYMETQINMPGDDAKNLSYDAFANRMERFKEGLNEDTSSILNMLPEKRIELIKYINYQSLFRDEYIVIDSRYRNTVSTDPTKIEFALITNSKARSDHGGIIVGNTLQDIIEIEVYPFTIPYKPVYATFYNRITLSIVEWTANSFEAYEGGQYHFLFDIDHIDNNLIYLKPINSIYSFSKPVNQIDTFSINFGAVFPKISFDADRMYPSAIDYSSTLGIFTFAKPHNIVTGDLVYITNFNTPEPALDVNTILEVNRAEGHTIVKKDNYSFIINVDLSKVYHQDANRNYPITSFNQLALVFFASKRIQIQMRLRYLTNYT